MNCPNCETPNPNLSDASPHCTGCGANLKAKKYLKADDPGTIKKELDETRAENAKLRKDVDDIKKHLQEKEDESNGPSPKRTLFGS